jgi:leader peptidase (prepilin peptidase)/N-methyltransferase
MELGSAGLLLAGILGLLIGSFLNVVIHRLPKMLERRWAAECAELSGQEAPEGKPFNLVTPRSHCPGCQANIRWYQNVPVLSWLVLRGRCADCGTRIGLRYPLVELLTAGLFAYAFHRHGLSPATLAWCFFSAALLALAFIDWDTTLLPDDITLPLLWAGLIASALHWTALPLTDALWGAVAGYLSLWGIYWLFKLATGKEGMGYGDFKLLAALGAWFGWQALIPIVLMSSVIGAVVGILLKVFASLREGGYVPFGPFLAGAGFAVMFFGPQAILDLIGL